LMLVRLSFKLIMFYHIFFLDFYIMILTFNVNHKQEKEMDKDKIIQSLLKMLQKNNSEMINLNIQIDDLTDKLNTANAVEKKENENEESNIRTVQTEKPN
jgi:7-cyano-7-deazaguanine synthase in queuosine biosynthesis